MYCAPHKPSINCSAQSSGRCSATSRQIAKSYPEQSIPSVKSRRSNSATSTSLSAANPSIASVVQPCSLATDAQAPTPHPTSITVRALVSCRILGKISFAATNEGSAVISKNSASYVIPTSDHERSLDR